MAATIIHLQQQLIQVLQLVVLSDNNGVDFGRLQNVSDRSRSDAVSAMTELSQRLAAAAPLSTILRAPLAPIRSAAYCTQAIIAQDRYKRKDWGERIGAVCGSCGWKVPFAFTHNGFLAEWHFFCSHLSDPGDAGNLRCFLTRGSGINSPHNCDSTTSMTRKELLRHMRAVHGFSDATL
jgi:hypothetical protein